MLDFFDGLRKDYSIGFGSGRTKIVVKGLFTNRLGDQYVKITKTVTSDASGGAEN
ncbi:MAG: hypothetical protein U5K54_04640 [Cytophagales bacterium]|nr:hypothetical protein [Cytophagales bacterium]